MRNVVLSLFAVGLLLSASHRAAAQVTSPGVVTPSSCGTGATASGQSSLTRGTISTGSTSTSSCVITGSVYAQPLPAAPVCLASAYSGTTPVAASVGSRTAAGFTLLLASAITSGTIDYTCQ